jgi:2-(1,2-epoxy-1,2-dihydrophenyl)acetyl-CoA isomerase
MKKLLREQLEAVAGDEGVRAVVLAAQGPAFCVGQDLGEHAVELRRRGPGAFDTVDEDYSPIVQLLATMPKPVVAAVKGACVGAGLGLALACDLRVVAEDARMATAFTAIGLTCDSGLSRTLVEAVGLSRARELVLSGRAFTAAEAERWGVSLEIVPVDRVDERAESLAADLAAGPTAAYAESKVLLAAAAAGDLRSALANESAAQHRLGATEDHAHAVEAFLAKRTVTFRGY